MDEHAMQEQTMRELSRHAQTADGHDVDEPGTPGRASEPQTPGRASEPQPPGRASEPQTPGRASEPQTPGRASEPQPPGRASEPQTPGRASEPAVTAEARAPQPPPAAHDVPNGTSARYELPPAPVAPAAPAPPAPFAHTTHDVSPVPAAPNEHIIKFVFSGPLLAEGAIPVAAPPPAPDADPAELDRMRNRVGDLERLLTDALARIDALSAGLAASVAATHHNPAAAAPPAVPPPAPTGPAPAPPLPAPAAPAAPVAAGPPAAPRPAAVPPAPAAPVLTLADGGSSWTSEATPGAGTLLQPQQQVAGSFAPPFADFTTPAPAPEAPTGEPKVRGLRRMIAALKNL